METSLGYTVRQKSTKFTFHFEMTFWSTLIMKISCDFYVDQIHFVVFEISRMSLNESKLIWTSRNFQTNESSFTLELGTGMVSVIWESLSRVRILKENSALRG